MNAYLIALIPPFLFALSNHLDKFILSRYFKHGGTGALIIISGLFALIVLPIIFLISPGVLSIPAFDGTLIAASGVLSIIGVLLYLYAVQEDDIASVAPLFQLIPAFTLVFGYLILGELPRSVEIIGGALIILGSLLLTFESSGKFAFKHRIFWLMASSSLVISMSAVAFKFVATRTDYWTTAFWSQVGIAMTGIAFFIFVKSWRNELISHIRNDKGIAMLLNLINELINSAGMLIFAYATLLIPIASVQFISGTQPLFLIGTGLALATFFPSIGIDKPSKRHLLQRCLSVLMMLAGLAFIYLV